MLSRLAWQLYWIGRHLERAEITSRALLAYDILSMHPQGRNLSDWNRLLEALGQSDDFIKSGGDVDDGRQVFRFLSREKSNPNSLLGSVAAMRGDMRAARGLLPTELWQYGGRLRDLASEPAASAGRRRLNLEDFIRLCRASAGVITTAMRRDTAFHFWQIGRRLECADMTCRLLLVEGLTDDGDSGDDSPMENLRWANVLYALGLAEAYRDAAAGRPVTGARVTDFIVNDSKLPRSVSFCLTDTRDCLQFLPANEKPLAAMARAAKAAKATRGGERAAIQLRRTLSLIAFAADAITAAYFAGLK